MTKILLVEDDKSLREIYGVRLLAEGYDIISAGDGEEALAMAIKEQPSLIVSDVMMPKISGFDMLDILRSTTETKNIKVIMMTALSSEDQRDRGVALGADRYLVKSQVGIEDVVRTVHEVLGDAPVSMPTNFSTPTPAPAAEPEPVPAPTPDPTPAPVPEPVTPVAPPTQPAPEPAPTPAPEPPTPAPVAPPVSQAPVPPTPVPEPVAPMAPPATPPASSANPLPQPMAPFSTPRPANLADRVIHPPEHVEEPKDLGLMIDEELSGVQVPNPTSIAPEPTTPQIGNAFPQPTFPDNNSAPHGPVEMPQPPLPVAPAPTPQPPAEPQAPPIPPAPSV